MSVSSKEMKWSTNAENFGGNISYTKTTQKSVNGKITEKDSTDIVPDLGTPDYHNTNNGFYYTCNLPTNASYVSGGSGISYSFQA